MSEENSKVKHTVIKVNTDKMKVFLDTLRSNFLDTLSVMKQEDLDELKRKYLRYIGSENIQ